ncbi:Mo25 family protein [Striga asiatica]|uniref:Mo25 family protein n=1 Tax=Striga asiatica TaxID=4170 RepID=A0A5A7PD15_STRAF|nr:Mo25 family protein [Striga asiatica]
MPAEGQNWRLFIIRTRPTGEAGPPSQSVTRSLSPREEHGGGGDSTKMKSLFKSKPKTPVDLVRQTRDLLVLVDRGGADVKEIKRDEKVCFVSVFLWRIVLFEEIVFGDLSLVCMTL